MTPLAISLILVPLLLAAAAWFDGNGKRLLKLYLPAGALLHCAGTLLYIILFYSEASTIIKDKMLFLDRTALPFLLITSILFLCVSLHAQIWFPAELAKAQREDGEGKLQSLRLFVPCLLAFLGTMTLVMCSRNFGLLWVAVEATTLASAPLILFHRSKGSLEAMWKYMLICSVGIGLALFGTMLMAVAANGIEHGSLDMGLLMAGKNALHPHWFKAAFIFVLAGYGTKMGLAPFHTWLPDAHSEAPGGVSALLSGALLNCSFLGIFRFLQICPPALKPFCNQMLVAAGLLSMLVAVFFIFRQPDFKRMLAYSSVEHMGLAAIFCGIGIDDMAIIHLCFHSFIKMSLFLLAGNILLAYGTRSVRSIGGMFRRMPATALFWITGMLLICGTPPSPLFFTELRMIIQAPFWLGASVFLMLAGIFAGMSMICLKICMGNEGRALPEEIDAKAAEKSSIIPAIMLTLVIICGCFIFSQAFSVNDGNAENCSAIHNTETGDF